MTNKEFKAAREKMEMTQEAFAAFLGLCGSTVRNYESGRRSIPPLVADGIMARVDALAKNEDKYPIGYMQGRGAA